jgi:hypothetical protein
MEIDHIVEKDHANGELRTWVHSPNASYKSLRQFCTRKRFSEQSWSDGLTHHLDVQSE